LTRRGRRKDATARSGIGHVPEWRAEVEDVVKVRASVTRPQRAAPPARPGRERATVRLAPADRNSGDGGRAAAAPSCPIALPHHRPLLADRRR